MYNNLEENKIDIQLVNGVVKKVDKNLIYNASFNQGNTVIVGKPNTGKTAYVTTLIQKGFPGIKEMYYVAPHDTLSEDRIDKIRQQFTLNYDHKLYFIHQTIKKSNYKTV